VTARNFTRHFAVTADDVRTNWNRTFAVTSVKADESRPISVTGYGK
jgi:hypothetical protein